MSGKEWHLWQLCQALSEAEPSKKIPLCTEREDRASDCSHRGWTASYHQVCHVSQNILVYL